ncbi:MAG: Holliday junction branch migration protein RuvA [Lawsonella sp.]
MIASLTGVVERILLDSVIIETGGVGYRVFATPETLAQLRVDNPATILTEMVVREDSLTLYGFKNSEEQDLFLLLQKVSGIGPRMALAILAVLDPQTLSQAIQNEDTATLKQVPGVGKRVSERLIVELKDKVEDVVSAAPMDAADTASSPSGLRAEVTEALTGLGFATTEISKAISSVLAENPDADAATVLRQSLIRLGGRS